MLHIRVYNLDMDHRDILLRMYKRRHCKRRLDHTEMDYMDRVSLVVALKLSGIK